MAMRRTLSSAKGQFLVFVAVAFVLLGLFVGLAIDLGRAYLLRSQLSGLVDAAALAAANVLQGQVANQDVAAKAACDSMLMNGMQVAFDSGTNTCTSTGGSFSLSVNFVPKTVPGGPPIQFVQVSGSAPLNTTFMRLAKFITGNTLSSIQVAAFAEGGPERPVDLALVLDRSGSMNQLDGSGQQKIVSLKNAVNEFLNSSFTPADQVAMVSFGSRGCGAAGGLDYSQNNDCIPDQSFGVSISTIQSAVGALCNGGANNCSGGTNTMEAIRTAGDAMAPLFNDPSRDTSRKALLLVTDGQPTFMRRFNTSQCRSDPFTGTTLPPPGNTGAFPNGCLFGVPGNPILMFRTPLTDPNSFPCSTRIPQVSPCGSSAGDNPLYLDVIRSTRDTLLGAMYEADRVRNYGYNGGKDIVIFAIAIGTDLGLGTGSPQQSLDANAKCLLARIANDPGSVSNCDSVYTTTDNDTHDDLKQGIPFGSCTSTPDACIDTTQQQGKVFTVDMNGNVQSQLATIFNEIAALLKLRLTI